jgi:hypothetical protein
MAAARSAIPVPVEMFFMIEILRVKMEKRIDG